MSRSHPDADGLDEAEEIVRELRTAYTERVEANTYGVHVAVETVESGHERFRDLSTAFITAYVETNSGELSRQNFSSDLHL
ncbi:hypothetical protein ACNO8S_12195 [Haloarcula sp. KBTZ06]|uniref:hypothetical protein n=1 Tax=Haloarcula sp. KBTZ06 TaxID=3402682 RepID=UPI003B43266E